MRSKPVGLRASAQWLAALRIGPPAHNGGCADRLTSAVSRFGKAGSFRRTQPGPWRYAEGRCLRWLSSSIPCPAPPAASPAAGGFNAFKMLWTNPHRLVTEFPAAPLDVLISAAQRINLVIVPPGREIFEHAQKLIIPQPAHQLDVASLGLCRNRLGRGLLVARRWREPHVESVPDNRVQASPPSCAGTIRLRKS
jgi:hypothetical protein